MLDNKLDNRDDFVFIQEELLKKFQSKGMSKYLLVNVLLKRAHQIAKGMQGPGFNMHKAIKQAIQELMEDKLVIKFKDT